MSGFDFALIVEYLPDFWRGARATIFYSLTSLGLAVAIGLVMALCRMSQFVLLRLMARGYIDAIRGTPALIQIFFVYFGLPMFGLNLSAPTAAVIALGINSGGYLAEIFRAGIMGVDSGQTEAGRSLGMSYGKTMWRITLPQAALLVVPPAAGEFTNLVKGTSLLSTISVSELTRVAQQIVGVTFRPIEAYVAIGVVYYCLNAIIAQGAVWLERWLRKSQGLE
ncbi:MAG: amino acid ABC transporter permease [Albidovulum sp.]|nr:amino acid ABC transporter permease [Albidovulum sp.]MDE0306548.1 amino acid ABC transporter permease [Albidovulum sp.]MDE0531192.1 amino acid ABC transporter permease [Albidovulum sp.]